MTIQEILERLRELEKRVDDAEVAELTLRSDGSGHIEMDGEECANFFNLEDMSKAFDTAYQNIDNWLNEFADEVDE